MKQDIAVYMKDAVVRPVLIFDGDQRRDHADVRHMPGSQVTPTGLDQIIAAQAGVKLRFDQDSNASEDLKVEARKSYLEYFRTHVLYLPFMSPEQELWSGDAAKTLLDAAGVRQVEADALLVEFDSMTDYKKRFAALSAAAGNMHPQVMHPFFVMRFARLRPPMYALVVDVLNRALAATGAANA